jgi:hypothetical protein
MQAVKSTIDTKLLAGELIERTNLSLMESWPWETIKHEEIQRTTDDSGAKVTRVVRVHGNYLMIFSLPPSLRRGSTDLYQLKGTMVDLYNRLTNEMRKPFS